jgi:hypothetical protein
MTRGRRRALAGGGIALVYLAVAAATSLWSGRPTLPLFEGAGPLPAYQWMEPPCDFRAGNVVPHAVTARVTIGAKGNEIGGATSSDRQFIVTLAPGSVPPHGTARAATLRVTPIKPSRLRLPHRLVADGNGYELTVTYDDGTRLARFANKVDYLLRAPTTADAGVYVRDPSGSWTKAQTFPTVQTNHYPMETTVLGTFLAATSERVFAGTVCASSSGAGSPIVAIVVAILAAALLGAVVTYIVVRRRQTSRPASRGTDRSGAPQRKRR